MVKMHDNDVIDPVPLLFVGDIHIGRRPEALASKLEAAGLDAQELSPRAAWSQMVDYAIERNVAGVLLAGDVIDREEHLLEAYRAVEQGAKRLQKAHIPLLAIAGNHDAKLLPRLARQVPSVVLLGEGGTWGSHTLHVDGRRVDIIGWSFPDAHWTRNPLRDPSLHTIVDAPREGACRMMVLHGDLDVRDSNYAPITRAELERCDVDAALLGHIHSPDPLDESKPIGYLGSLVGLDAGETGVHGPVEVRIAADGSVSAQRVAIAPIRWDNVTVDVSQDASWRPESLLHHVSEQIRVWVDAQHLHAATRVVALRVTLSGRRALAQWHESLQAIAQDDASCLTIDSAAAVIVDRYIDATALTIDLEAERKEHTPIGRLARFLDEGPTAEQLRAAGDHIRKAREDESLGRRDDMDVETRLRAAAQRTLERMIAAREQENVS